MSSRFETRHIVEKQARDQGRAGRFAAKKRRKKVFTAIMFGICLFLIFFDLSEILDLDFWRVKNIRLEGVDPEISASVYLAAKSAVDGNYFWLIPKDNTVFLSKKNIEESIKQVSPRIVEVKVDRQGLDTIALSVAEKSPLAVVCAELPDFSSAEVNKDCYLADENSLVYMKAPADMAGSFRRFYVPALGENASSTPIGKPFLEKQTFAELINFYDAVKNNSPEILGLLIKNSGEYELYMTDKNNEEGQNPAANTTVVYFNQRNGLSEQLDNFLAFWSHMKTLEKAGAEAKHYDSIDLRYGPNIFYRLSADDLL